MLAALVVSVSAWVPVAAAGDIGFQGPSFGSTAPAPTAEKPQSKLWFHDGRWWGSLFNPAASRHEIHRLDTAAQSWQATGTPIDARDASWTDMLWTGAKLYALSHSHPGASDNGIRLMRYSYDAATQVYTLDTGFPVTIASLGVEAATIDQDSTGLLWASWTRDESTINGPGRKVYVTHSTAGDDRSWVTPYVLPVTWGTSKPAEEASDDDISSVVAYDGKVGVMWSNEFHSAVYFASHVDGAGDRDWSLVRPLQGRQFVDDHLNIKSITSDPAGRVFAAVKSNLNEGAFDPTAPLIWVLVLGVDDVWRQPVIFSRAKDNHTRPQVVVDRDARRVHVVAAGSVDGTYINSGTAHTGIFHKSAPLDAVAFEDGQGEPLIQTSAYAQINNPTSTKQPVTTESGLLVLASDATSKHYFHNFVGSGGGGGPVAPDTSIVSGPSGAVSSTSASFEFTATAPSSFECRVDGGAWYACTSPEQLSGLSQGGHAFEVRATDAEGLTDPTPARRTWTVDTVAPTVSITSPTDGASVKGTVQVSATAGLAGDVVDVRFVLDGQTTLGTDTSAPYSINWNSRKAGVGSHTLTAVVRDAAGNATTSAPVTVTVRR